LTDSPVKRRKNEKQTQNTNTKHKHKTEQIKTNKKHKTVQIKTNKKYITASFFGVGRCEAAHKSENGDFC